MNKTPADAASRDVARFGLALVPFIGLLTIFSSLSANAIPVEGDRGMVAAPHPLASAVGVDVLRRGGNAVDAVVATVLAMGVVEPYASSLGGGGFAVVHMNGTQTVFDFREQAPAVATPDRYAQTTAGQQKWSTQNGATAVGVPGLPAGLAAMFETFGTLELATLAAPAIALAEEGFIIDARLRGYLEYRFDLLATDRAFAEVFLVAEDDGYRVPPVGHRIVQRDLARSLRVLSAEGFEAFYSGSIADGLVADMSARQGPMTAQDLRDYRVERREPLRGAFADWTWHTVGPPSAGGYTLLFVLGVMERTFGPTSAWPPYRSVDVLHTFVEATKRAFADRVLFGDPRSVDSLVGPLLAADRLDLVAAVLDDQATPPTEVPPGQGAALPWNVAEELRSRPAPSAEGPNTSHVSVIDRHGNAVSLTTSINYPFGAGIMAAGTGVIWNNHMDDFAVAPGVANAYRIAGSSRNRIAPGNRPVSSMAPVIATDARGAVRLVLGTPGGSRIPTVLIQVIYHHLKQGLPIDQAIAAGRLHHQHTPSVVEFERWALDPLTVQALSARGHDVIERGNRWSNVAAISVDADSGRRRASLDPRGVGQPHAE